MLGRRLGSQCGWTLASLLAVGCSLTHSLDDLKGDDDAGPGSGGASGSSAGATWAGSSGTGGASSGGAGGSGASAGGSGGSAGSSGSGGAAGSIGKDPPWWDGTWPSRVRLDIANASALVALESSYEVGFAVDPQLFGSSTTTYAVVRYDALTQSWTPRPFHVEQAGGSSWVWTPLASSLDAGATDTSSWLYAGKAGASSGDPASVFTFWDGFETPLAGNWYVQGSPSVSGGDLVLPAYSSIRSQTTYESGYAIDYSMTVETQVDAQFEWICGGFQRTSDFDNSEPWLLWITRAPGTIQAEANIDGNGKTGSSSALGPGQNRIYGVERYATYSKYRLNNVIVDEITWPAPTTNLQLRFSVQSDNALARFGFVRVRKARDPQPVVSFGAVETGP